MTILSIDSLFMLHETGEHPERPQRLAAISDRLDSSGLAARCPLGPIEVASREQLEWLHTPGYLDWLQQQCAAGGGRIESDTVVSAQSWDVACTAAGTAIAAVDQILKGVDSTAFVATRPPGHHALADRPMGFCLFSNVGLAAERALREYGLKRVLIIDWDVHHGNGTQDLFYDRDDVWLFSAHRSPFYPGTGAADETGTGRGVGATWNLPLEFGVGRHDYRERFATMLDDVATRCRPELVILSAGFDAHAADPIGSLELETEDFGFLTSLVQEVAKTYAQGRLLSVLEGGYNLLALAESVEVHLQTLLE